MLTFSKVKSNCLPNLYAATRAGREVGFIQKPRDTRSDKSAWRAFVGIGEGAVFVGHSWTKAGAQALVESAYSRENNVLTPR